MRLHEAVEKALNMPIKVLYRSGIRLQRSGDMQETSFRFAVDEEGGLDILSEHDQEFSKYKIGWKALLADLIADDWGIVVTSGNPDFSVLLASTTDKPRGDL